MRVLVVLVLAVLASLPGASSADAGRVAAGMVRPLRESYQLLARKPDGARRRKSLRPHLTPGRRRVVASVGMIHARDAATRDVYTIGTGFVVQRSPGRALVLTNAHVHDIGRTSGQPLEISFGAEISLRPDSDRKRMKVKRAIASSAVEDWALLEVEVPRGTRVSTAPLSAAGHDGEVYSTGFDHLTSVEADPRRTGTGVIDPADRPLLRSLTPRTHYQSIQTGRTLLAGAWLATDYLPGREGQVQPTVFTSLPAVPGASGSPVIRADDDRVVGIKAFGYGVVQRDAEARRPRSPRATGHVPMRVVLDGLHARLDGAHGGLEQRDRAAVRKLLRDAGWRRPH